MSDDIGMEALAGDHGQRAAACVAAGCDVRAALRRQDGKYAAGRRRGRRDLAPKEAARLARAMAMRFTPDDEMDFAEAVAKRDALLALV